MYRAKKLKSRHILYAQHKFKRELKQRRSHKARVLRRNLRLQQEKSREPQRTLLVAPVDFSVLESREAVIQYFEDVKSHIDKKIYVRMDLSAIKNIELPTLCLLSAFMLDKRTDAKYLQVVIPGTQSPLRKIFQDAQFEEQIVANKRPYFTSGSFLSRSDKNINEKYISDVLQKTVGYFGKGKEKRLKNLSPIIMEIITNTSNHADPEEQNTMPWLLNTLEREKDGKKIKQYCIIDLGVGIYDSIYDKTEQWQKHKKRPHKWMSDLRGRSQSSFLTHYIPKGIQSSTSLPGRGKGIKFIYDTAKDGIYKRFEIITNKARVNLLDISPAKKDSTSNLEGTIYYWEIGVE